MAQILQDERAARLRTAREAAGYSNAAKAAQAMGIPEPTYQAHENSNRGFIMAAERYADFFRVNLDWLLSGRGPMKRGQSPVEDANDLKVAHGHEIADETAVTTPLINTRNWPRDVPVLGIASCGEDGLFELNGETIDHAPRSPRFAGVKGGYALYVSGESMFPWRPSGDPVYVTPHQPAQIGDFVVVQLHPEKAGDPPRAYIKQLVRRTAESLKLHQFNPAEDKTIPMKKVKSIHRIMDWREFMGV